MSKDVAVIVGAGRGLSASLARLFATEGMQVVLAARNTEKLAPLAQETGALLVQCDATREDEVSALFAEVKRERGLPSLVVFNAGARTRGPIETLDAQEVLGCLLSTCFGGFIVGQAASRALLEAGAGTLIFTGATASVKGFPHSAPFAMGKFGLRGLAQSLARELAPRNIHVAHVVIDGGIATTHAPADEPAGLDRWLDPEAIAREYLHLHRQHRSAWTWEVEVRSWTEKF